MSVVHVCNRNTWEVETEEFCEFEALCLFLHSRLWINLDYRMRPCIKNRNKKQT